MTKLFTVSVSFDYVVAADDIDDAYIVASDNFRDACCDLSRHDVEYSITPGVSAVGWDGMCIPYGGDGNTRTKDYPNE